MATWYCEGKLSLPCCFSLHSFLGERKECFLSNPCFPAQKSRSLPQQEQKISPSHCWKLISLFGVNFSLFFFFFALRINFPPLGSPLRKLEEKGAKTEREKKQISPSKIGGGNTKKSYQKSINSRGYSAGIGQFPPSNWSARNTALRFFFLFLSRRTKKCWEIKSRPPLLTDRDAFN